MKKERKIVAQVVDKRNDLVDCLEKQKVVIFIEGDLYEKMGKKLLDNKSTKKVAKVGLGIATVSTFIVPGSLIIWMMLLEGGILLSSHIKDEIKKYKVVNNKECKRLELYLSKGANKFNEELDTIENY